MITEDCANRGETTLALDGQGIYYHFGRKKKKSSVLNGVNIAVPRGLIYSLLGPSGCGKTTLLKCIIGQLRPKAGSLKIYGKVPGSNGFFIPGQGVGYMPQDLALYPEMTTEETLTFFGSLYHMSRQEVTERISFLVDLLDLPDKKRPIKELSGGQQRRVSFASALIHKPPLLILDEPTVGVDPLLRQTIWDHLVDLTRNERLTIIITTHYIEEARQAHFVGMMRDGRLLAEKNPEDLIKQYRAITLEDVFLRLCQSDSNEDEYLETSSDVLTSVECLSPKSLTQNTTPVWLTKEENELYTNAMNVSHHFEADEKKCNGTFHEKNDTSDNTVALLSQPSPPDEVDTSSSDYWFSLARFLSLLTKNFLCLKRSIPVMVFQMVVPTLQIIVFCMAVGADPFDLPLAIANMEQAPDGFSKKFLNSISNWTINQKHFGNISLAIDSVKNGDSWAAVYIGPEFTTCLVDRFLEGADVSNDTVECSDIKLYMDMSNQQIVGTIYTHLLESFQTFAESLLAEFGKNPLLATLPLKLEDPIYGSSETSFTEFMSPGMVLSISYIMSISLTSMSIILEKKNGLLDRTFAAGSTVSEVLLALFCTLVVMMVMQNCLMLLCTFFMFNLTCNGPFFWVLVGVLLVGVNGMAYGLLISSMCDDENVAILISMGTFYPNFLLSGVIWPVEGMPRYLRYFSYCLPITLITNSIRSILTRGWSILDYQVWDGFLISISWTLFFLILSTILFKIRK